MFGLNIPPVFEVRDFRYDLFGKDGFIIGCRSSLTFATYDSAIASNHMMLHAPNCMPVEIAVELQTNSLNFLAIARRK